MQPRQWPKAIRQKPIAIPNLRPGGFDKLSHRVVVLFPMLAIRFSPFDTI
jgi:hypothetical protein